MKKSEGFTLIELMIVLVIIGILAAVAVPNYTSYVAKSNRKELLQVMVQAAGMQEQIFTDTRQYASDPSKLGVPGRYIGTNADKFKIIVAVNSKKDKFKILATAVGGLTGYQGKHDSGCTSFIIDESGRTSMKASKALINETAYDNIKAPTKANDKTTLCVRN